MARFCKTALVATLAACLALTPLSAQNARGEAGEKAADVLPPLQAAAELLQAYRFDEAARALEAAPPDAEAADLLRRARIGAEMLRGTERVVFVDSLVVPLAELASYVYMGADEGAVMPASQWAGPGSDGATVYINGLGDKAVFAMPDSAGTLRLAAANRIGGDWDAPDFLPLPAPADTEQGFPFLMPDGATLYYAAKGPESLGGYDLYVTRYDPERKAFLRPASLGMPFCSTADDYLYVIDEDCGIGYFATARGQAPDSVCLYYFLPSESREVVEGSEAEQTAAARIASVAATQTDSALVADARRRLLNLREKRAEASGEAFRFVIDDDTVYTSLQQFRNGQARRIATQWATLRREAEAQQTELDDLRRKYASATPEERASLRHDILRLERATQDAAASLRTMAKNFRRTELGKN